VSSFGLHALLLLIDCIVHSTALSQNQEEEEDSHMEEEEEGEEDSDMDEEVQGMQLLSVLG
jgi:hypothetical protein